MPNKTTSQCSLTIMFNNTHSKWRQKSKCAEEFGSTKKPSCYFAQFSAIFRLSSVCVFQYKSKIVCPSAILFTFYMLWLYDVVTFYINYNYNYNYNYTNVRLSTNMRLHCCQLLLFSVNGLIS